MRTFTISLSLLLAASVACAETNVLPFVSPMFGDNMVLQRGKTNTIWGWAKPGEEIHVEVASQSLRSKAGADGRWQVPLLPPAKGGPYTLAISGAQKVSFTNI